MLSVLPADSIWPSTQLALTASISRSASSSTDPDCVSFAVSSSAERLVGGDQRGDVVFQALDQSIELGKAAAAEPGQLGIADQAGLIGEGVAPVDQLAAVGDVLGQARDRCGATIKLRG